jgi:transposase
MFSDRLLDSCRPALSCSGDGPLRRSQTDGCGISRCGLCNHLSRELPLRRARRLFPFIKRIFADGGYAGEKMALVVWRIGTWKLEIVKRLDTIGFEILSKRWIVERTFAWISRNRRLARDFERYATTVAAFVRLAMIRIMLRRLAAANYSS